MGRPASLASKVGGAAGRLRGDGGPCCRKQAPVCVPDTFIDFNMVCWYHKSIGTLVVPKGEGRR